MWGGGSLYPIQSGGPVRSSARVLRHVRTHRPTTAPNNLARMPEKTQGFTEDQVEDFKEVFQLFDTKGDGLIQVGGVLIIKVICWCPGLGILYRGRRQRGPDRRVACKLR